MLVATSIPKPDPASTTNLFAANWAAQDTVLCVSEQGDSHPMRAHQHGTISCVAKPSSPEF